MRGIIGNDNREVSVCMYVCVYTYSSQKTERDEIT
jgi:hypothetical protein